MSEARVSAPKVRVHTALGELEGLARGDHQAFLGVPFAESPVGPRRFCAPRPPVAWTGIRAATAFGNSAIQGTHPIVGMAASGPRDEDCLYLNVFTPAADGGKRPVMFWIHGGGFQLGSGSEALYDGGPLARRGNVVVVTIHYRLGALGYLYLGGLGGDAWGATANAGQLDQIAALEWVREHIGAFGGDADNVTIFGESAGSAAVAALLAMPAAKGLFKRAILQSGTANRIGNLESATAIARRLVARAGSVDALRSLPASEILAVQLAAVEPGIGAQNLGPIVDGKTLPMSSLDAVRNGAARDVEVIIGTNRDEMKLFTAMTTRAPLDEATLLEQVEDWLPKRLAGRAAHVVAVYRTHREGKLPCSNLDILDAIQSDVRFRMPAIRLAEAQSGHQARTFMYLFDWESPARRGALGACHALEMPFVFGTLTAPTQDRFAGKGEVAERLSRNMMDAWLAFARTGDPSHAGIGTWSGYDALRRATMIFGPNTGLTEAPFEVERKVWQEES